MNLPEEILSFWFGDIGPDQPVPAERSRLWFGGDVATDARIRERFLGDLERAVAGEYSAWENAPRSSLALILLLDQFSRNIFRDSPAAFANDSQALSIALAGIDAGYDRQLSVLERAFYYMPLEHSEDLATQERSVAAFRALIDLASPAQQPTCQSFYEYAIRHREIIARFNRFPHRNRILGRPSTPEEVAFLKQPGSSF